jgi:hypothetical protein
MNFDSVQTALKVASGVLGVLACIVSVIGWIALRRLQVELLKERLKKVGRRTSKSKRIEGLGDVVMTEISTASRTPREVRVAGLVVGPQLSTGVRGIDGVMSEKKQLMSPSVKELAHG